MQKLLFMLNVEAPNLKVHIDIYHENFVKCQVGVGVRPHMYS